MTIMPLRYIGFAAMAAAVQGQPDCLDGGLFRFDAAIGYHTASDPTLVVSTSTAAACADQCLADEGNCEGFTWRPPTDADDLNCFLHEFQHRFTDLVPSDGASYYDKTPCRATCSDTVVNNYNQNAGVRPKWGSSWIRDFDDYTVEQCAQACWDQAACLSFTMLNRNIEGVDGTRCQLYQREFSDAGLTPSLVSSGDKDKDTYVQQKCTRSGARAQFQRAGGFRSTNFTVENRTTKDGAPILDEAGQPETRNVYVRSAYVVPTDDAPETGYRPKNGRAFTASMSGIATVESCQEFCVSVGLLKCKGYLFRPDTGGCKTYSTAYGPNYLVASPTKVFYRLAL